MDYQQKIETPKKAVKRLAVSNLFFTLSQWLAESTWVREFIDERIPISTSGAFIFGEGDIFRERYFVGISG